VESICRGVCARNIPFQQQNNHGAQAYAARAAGYGNAKSKPLTLAQQGYKLMRDPRIQAAIAEESRNMRRNAAPEVIRAWLNMVRDPTHAGHVRAVAMGLDRDEPLVTQQKIDVTHTHVDRNQEEIEELRALRHLGTSQEKLVELFGANGLARLEDLDAAQRARDARVIDGEAVEVQKEQGDGQT
jgi:hypothetical protein